MKTRKTLEDPNAERIIRLFEIGAALNWFSSETTELRYDELMDGYDYDRDNTDN